MNNDIIQGKLTQFKGHALKIWGKITHDDWDSINGDREILVGRLQERYGWAKDEAESRVAEQISEWEKSSRS